MNANGKLLYDNVIKKVNKDIENSKLEEKIKSIRKVFHTSNIRDIEKNILAINQDFINNIETLFNNSVYRPKNKITNFGEAVVLLGKYQVQDLALYHTILQNLIKEPTDHLKKIVFHNFSVGIIAATIGPIIIGMKCDFAALFAAGLYHNFGKLVLLNYEKGIYLNVFDEAIAEHLNYFEVEERVFGESLQLKIAVELTIRFDYPSIITEAIKGYRQPDITKFAPEASIIQMSDIIATALCIGETGDYKLPALTKYVAQHFNFTADNIKLCFKESAPRLADIPQIVKILLNYPKLENKK